MYITCGVAAPSRYQIFAKPAYVFTPLSTHQIPLLLLSGMPKPARRQRGKTTRPVRKPTKAQPRRAVRGPKYSSVPARRAHPRRPPASAVYPSKSIDFKSSNAPVAITPPDGKKAAQDYVFALLEPWAAFERDLDASVPDGNMTSCTRFWSRNVVNVSSIANTASGTYDTFFSLTPFGNKLYGYATSFDPATGVPNATTIGTANNYSSWGTNFDSIRCVALGVQIRNTQAAGSESGDCIQFRVPVNTFNPGGSSVAWATLASQNDAVLRGLTKPGDMGLAHWRPMSASAGGDRQFKPPSANYTTYNTPGASATAIGFWSQGGAGSAFEFTIYAHWEARPLPTVGSLFDVVTLCPDPSIANNLLMKALAECPDYCQDRVVATDDGDLGSVVSDIQAIYGGIKGAWNAAKSVGSVIADFFGFLSPHEKVARALEHFAAEPSMFDLLVLYTTSHPGCTLADALAYFYTFPSEGDEDDWKSAASYNTRITQSAATHRIAGPKGSATASLLRGAG